MPISPEWLATFPDGHLKNLHDESACAGEYCVVHNPSDHPLRGLPMYLGYKGQVWRECKHNNKTHPDPDSTRALERLYPSVSWWVHLCCGCCCPHGLYLWEPMNREEPCDALCEDMMFATNQVNLDLWRVVSHEADCSYMAVGDTFANVMHMSVLTNSPAPPPPVVAGSPAVYHGAQWTLLSFTTTSTKHGWDTVWKLHKIGE